MSGLERTYSGILAGEPVRTSIVFKVDHAPGALETVVSLFARHQLNMTRIESRPSNSKESSYDFYVDFEGMVEDPEVQQLLRELSLACKEVQISNPKEVPWFPRKISDLDALSTHTLDAGSDLESDHPGFHDREYRERRLGIVANAGKYSFGEKIPTVEYSESETQTWGAVYRKLKEFYPAYACSQFNRILPLLELNCGYSEDNIPQLEDISRYLQDCTGFRLRPVAGLLTARDFLNALAFRTFFSTQYIRHHSKPFYTPEPDCCHELLGHVPMFADQDFADFSHEIGLASLGASDLDIQRLATCYWFSVEFGLCRENEELKAYGAGLLSSFGELEYACADYRPAGGTSERPLLLDWDPSVAASTEYPITTYQPVYFVADSLHSATVKMKNFCENEIKRPFYVTYSPMTNSVIVDRSVKRLKDPVQTKSQS